MLSPFLGTLKGKVPDNPKDHPLKPFSLSTRRNRGWRATLATQSKGQDSPNLGALGFQIPEENSVPRNEVLVH